jgi:hypothetical protein
MADFFKPRQRASKATPSSGLKQQEKEASKRAAGSKVRPKKGVAKMEIVPAS